MGTHAHSWIKSFPEELSSFRKYAWALPSNCSFLVDTYNSLAGIENAIEASRWLRENRYEVMGIQLDSGDLAKLSCQARLILDKAGFGAA